MLFLSRQEIEAVGHFARAKKDALTKVLNNKKKPDAKAIEKLRKELKEHLEEHTKKNAVDVALFGRFVTSDEFDTVEGALQVAHGLGTQKVEVEYDYFTAVDDLGEGPGAGHLGESEFASSVLYLYACCELSELEQNLGARSATGRTVGCRSARACENEPARPRARDGRVDARRARRPGPRRTRRLNTWRWSCAGALRSALRTPSPSPSIARGKRAAT